MPSPTIVNRNAWEARDPKSVTPLVLGAQRGTALHYSGSLAEMKEDHRNCAGVVRGIQNFHMDIRGWADIAYSFLGCIHGALFIGRGRGVRTAAQGTTSGNDRYHAVCFLGGDKEGRADVTDEGKAALRFGVESCNSWANVHDVKPHSFFKPTGCPGDELRAWIQAGMPIPREDTVSSADVLEALQSDRGQFLLRHAVDQLMSQGLTGDPDGAIRGWAIKLESTDANVRKIMEHLGIPQE